MEDKFMLGGKEFHSRFILGSGKYNMNLIKAAVEQGGAEIITLALRRANTQESENILDYIPGRALHCCPTPPAPAMPRRQSGSHRLSRAMGCGDFVKVEIMRDAKYLFPDNQETVKATEILAKEGFVVLPYMNPGSQTWQEISRVPVRLRSCRWQHPSEATRDWQLRR